MFAHSLFRFDFFFVLKGLRLPVWKTKDLNIGGKGIRNISYANIADQIKFIDTITFYQESLDKLANSMEPIEQENIRKSLINFLESNQRLKLKWSISNVEEKQWVLDYLSGGKVVIPYEMLKEWEDLNAEPSANKEFFSKTSFYLSLKKSMVSDQEYEDVQKLYKMMNMSNLSDLNALYNFQDTIILAEIFENRARTMYQKLSYNPLKCSSASTLSGAIQRLQSKCILSFPTSADIIELMEKTLIGGMSIINTRVGFDTNLFVKDNQQQKLVYKIRNKDTNEIEDKRISTVIFKMDENNQYGNAMTKPLPIDCIKEESYTSTVQELCLILTTTSQFDTTGHLFVVDVEFDTDNTTEKEIFFNEIYTPIFEKKKVLPARDRSLYQLYDALRLKDNETLKNYKCTAKTHSTMNKKILIPLYAEHIKFLMERCRWKVTKVHRHYTFKQEIVKKNSVTGNQIARQNAKTSMEKNFYKLMNNSNFGYDCRNNFDNRYFSTVIDEVEEMFYIRKHHRDLSDPEISSLFPADRLVQEINQNFTQKFAELEMQRDQFYEAKKTALKLKEGNS